MRAPPEWPPRAAPTLRLGHILPSGDAWHLLMLLARFQTRVHADLQLISRLHVDLI